ncbi:MAG: acyltransferase family protein [Lachnospiraceae bacterium]|nr:acyltransferase family protein [Lachnospiraceae bacterium]
MRERQVWVDMLKGYGIIMVTLGHLGIAPLLEKHIYSYHMFLFFLISGYLVVDRRFTETLKKKTQTLLVPFIMWDLISSVIGAVMYHQSLKSFIAILFILKGNLCFNVPIWFLLVLYFTEIIYSFLKEKTSFSDELIVILSVILFLLIGTVQLPLKINLLPLALFSYAAGVIFKKCRILTGGGYSNLRKLNYPYSC